MLAEEHWKLIKMILIATRLNNKDVSHNIFTLSQYATIAIPDQSIRLQPKKKPSFLVPHIAISTFQYLA